MESPRGPKVWYFFSDDLPDGEILVPIRNEHGLAFAVRPGQGSMSQEMLDRLNEAADHVLGVGLAHLDVGQAGTAPREGK
jgi:hypothetical protein